MFHLSRYRPSSCKHLSHLSTSFCMPVALCSLRDDSTGNVATFNVYKWRHSDVIV